MQSCNVNWQSNKLIMQTHYTIHHDHICYIIYHISICHLWVFVIWYSYFTILGPSSPFAPSSIHCLYLDPQGASTNNENPPIMMKLPNPSVKIRYKKHNMPNQWFCLSEKYIFTNVMIEEFNNEHHQHRSTERTWCSWLNANPIPSYMI